MGSGCSVQYEGGQSDLGKNGGSLRSLIIWLAADSGRLFCVFLWLVCADVVLFHPYEVQ